MSKCRRRLLTCNDIKVTGRHGEAAAYRRNTLVIEISNMAQMRLSMFVLLASSSPCMNHFQVAKLVRSRPAR
ncbi:hypothetical protein AcV7_003856 [Taiwanofungus camphoratus]|nr:hypothetical protein AcV7_003856 [Antrodia cinnamomea]